MKKVGQVLRENLASNLKEGLQSRSNAFVLSYSRLSAGQMNNLRKDLKKIGAQVFVSKNRIAKIALKEIQKDSLAERIKGQTLFVWSSTDSAEVSKTLVKFSKEWEGLVIHGGLLEGAVMNESEIQRLSELPSRDVLLAQLLQVMQSPITGLMGVLNGKTRELIYLLKQLSEKKGGS